MFPSAAAPLESPPRLECSGAIAHPSSLIANPESLSPIPIPNPHPESPSRIPISNPHREPQSPNPIANPNRESRIANPNRESNPNQTRESFIGIANAHRNLESH